MQTDKSNKPVLEVKNVALNFGGVQGCLQAREL